MRPRNLHDRIPEELERERVEIVGSGPGVRIERIVSRGHRSPEGFWYDQAEDEWVLLVSGSATIAFEEEGSVDLGPGDYVDIPAHARHRIERTDPEGDTVWLAVFRKPSGTGRA